MTKHPYQTCLRMPLTLKEDMTTICDEYQVNESDLMRKAIEQFITNIRTNPEETSRYMFI
jgi:predicted DNA-binding protein